MRKRELISFLVPLKAGDPYRDRDWAWLRAYWKAQLPSAEICIGTDRKSRKKGVPFSKTAAVNDAFKKSHGDVLVIIDSDALLDARVVLHCAERIRAAMRAGAHIWAIPYQHLYRLTDAATQRLVESDPAHPLYFPTPPKPSDVESTQGSGHGHLFGAMCQIMPRKAFEWIGCMDPRMRGWGGEDSAFMRALDTLWGKHFKTPNDILHLWHPRVAPPNFKDPRGWEVRLWDGQDGSTRPNDWLSKQYAEATGKPVKMRALVDAGCCLLRWRCRTLAALSRKCGCHHIVH